MFVHPIFLYPMFVYPIFIYPISLSFPNPIPYSIFSRTPTFLKQPIFFTHPICSHIPLSHTPIFPVAFSHTAFTPSFVASHVAPLTAAIPLLPHHQTCSSRRPSWAAPPPLMTSEGPASRCRAPTARSRSTRCHRTRSSSSGCVPAALGRRRSASAGTRNGESCGRASQVCIDSHKPHFPPDVTLSILPIYITGCIFDASQRWP